MFSLLFSRVGKLFSWKPRAQDPPPNSSPDDSYLQKVVTYIPADIVAAYTAMWGVITQSSGMVPHWLSWVVFSGLLGLTPFYVCFLKTKPSGLTSNKIFHWVTSCIAFVAWVFALGGPFASLSWYQPVFGSIVLIFVTLTIPVMEGVFIKSPNTGGTPPPGGTGSGSGSGTPPGGDSPSKK